MAFHDQKQTAEEVTFVHESESKTGFNTIISTSHKAIESTSMTAFQKYAKFGEEFKQSERESAYSVQFSSSFSCLSTISSRN